MMTLKSCIGLAVVAGLAACSGAPAGTSAPLTNDDSLFTQAEETIAPTMTNDPVRSRGEVDFVRVATSIRVDSAPSGDPLAVAKLHAKLDALTGRQPSVQPPTQVPTAPAATVSSAVDGALFGFPGLTIADSDNATGTVAIVPPDQGLCAGNGFVVEAVNSALAIYDILGQSVSPPVDIARFFQFPPATATVSSFPSDPKCYFDQATGRFFATILRLPSDAMGNLLGSEIDIAVSQTGDPRGRWNVFEIEATDDGSNGSPNHPHCPCLGDQPLIGADTNGFYVSTNEFGLSNTSPGFNGAQIYALSKAALVAGNLGGVVHLANLVLANGIGFSVQPAFTAGGTGASDANGTEYFLSSLDFNGSLDNRVALWGLSNTKSLGADKQNVKLEHVVVVSETYGFPPPATQKSGPTPLRDCLAAGNCPGLGTTEGTNPIETVDTNDDRMNQAFLAGGSVWAALNTVAQVKGQTQAGIAWFAVEPKRLSNGALGARMNKQGYVAVANNNLSFPSLVLNGDGRGAMTFSIMGPDYFPSAAYVRFSAAKGAGDVRIAGAGAGPLDDWDGYAPFAASGGPVRYGDYSAALLDGDTLWMAAEFVPNACTALPCPGRDTFANWGTFVSRIDLADTVDQ
jgi:hypothetical protein